MRDIYKFECTAHVDGELACSAEIMIARQKWPTYKSFGITIMTYKNVNKVLG